MLRNSIAQQQLISKRCYLNMQCDVQYAQSCMYQLRLCFVVVIIEVILPEKERPDLGKV